jgi:hypothetical protein
MACHEGLGLAVAGNSTRYGRPQQSRNLLASNKRRPQSAWDMSEDHPPKEISELIRASLLRCEMHGAAGAVVRTAMVLHRSPLTKGGLKTA